MRFSSVLFWVILIISVLSYATAFILSGIFLFAYSDYSHLVETAWYTHEPIATQDHLSTLITFGTLPILIALVLFTATFLIETKIRTQDDHDVSLWIFRILGALALLGGGFHLYAAIKDYVGSTEMAAAAGVVDTNHGLLTIYGGYALGVAVLWIITAVALLTMSRRLRLDA